MQDLESKAHNFFNETNTEIEMVKKAENKWNRAKKNWGLEDNFKFREVKVREPRPLKKNKEESTSIM